MKNGDMPVSACKIETSEQGKSLGESSYMEYKGLTKREYFAAMAMQGMLSDPVLSDFKGSYEELASKVAKSSVSFANFLLAELAKECI
jgi:hypothetical protein